MGMTHVKMKVSNPEDRNKYHKISFLVDSGAFYSFVNEGVLKELGIKAEDTREFVLANGDQIKRKVGIARFEYDKQIGGAPVVFAQEGDENLLGATTLESLGLMLNPIKRILVPIKLTA